MRPALAEIDQTRTPPNASAGMSRASLALMMEYPPSRRTLLRAGGHAVLFAALARTPAFAAPKFLDDPFTLGVASGDPAPDGFVIRSEEHTSELQSLMRISYAVFCLQKHKHYQI